MKIIQITEADEPKADVSARAKLDHSLRAQGHKVVPDKKKELKKGKVKHKGKIEEGPLVLNRDSDLRNMLDTLLKSWLSQGDHSDEEFEKLLNALGYRMERDGQRTTLVKEENLEEAPGAIRKGMAAIALIAGLWGVNNHMAQKAYDASPQLQKLTAYLEVAKQHKDQRMIDQLKQRIENHKMRISIGKGEVMGKDGEPIDVVYDKEKSDGGSIASKMNWNEEKQRLDPKCWKGYKKQGTKMKGGVRVNNCVKA